MRDRLISVFTLLILVFSGISYTYARNAGQGGGQIWRKGVPCYQENIRRNQMRRQMTYQELDSNSDGQVTKQEHAAFQAKNRENRPGRGYQAEYNVGMFENIDTDGDQVISLDEFNNHRIMRNR